MFLWRKVQSPQREKFWQYLGAEKKDKRKKKKKKAQILRSGKSNRLELGVGLESRVLQRPPHHKTSLRRL